MTKAELEEELERVNTQLFQQEALIETMTEEIKKIKTVLEFTEGMLNIVDSRTPLFYHDWRGYRERSLS